jgi:tetratricopeptide (TPR) repeat protein
VLINLGCVQLELRDRRNARASYERALTISKTAYGPDHPEVATALVNLGICQLRLRELKRARVSLQEGLRISEEAYGPGHPEVASALTSLSFVQMRQGKVTDARASLERARAINNPGVAGRVRALQRVVSVSLALMNATTRRNRRGHQPGRARDGQSRPR